MLCSDFRLKARAADLAEAGMDRCIVYMCRPEQARGRLHGVLCRLGPVLLASPAEGLHLCGCSPLAIVVDSVSVTDLAMVVADLRRLYARVPIVVAADLPNWRDARVAFLAGATEYVSKSCGEPELVAKLNAAIEFSPPSHLTTREVL